MRAITEGLIVMVALTVHIVSAGDVAAQQPVAADKTVAIPQSAAKKAAPQAGADAYDYIPTSCFEFYRWLGYDALAPETRECKGWKSLTEEIVAKGAT